MKRLANVKSEFQKVTWATGQKLFAKAGKVMLAAACLAVLIYALDTLLVTGVSFVI